MRVRSGGLLLLLLLSPLLVLGFELGLLDGLARLGLLPRLALALLLALNS